MLSRRFDKIETNLELNVILCSLEVRRLVSRCPENSACMCGLVIKPAYSFTCNSWMRESLDAARQCCPLVILMHRTLRVCSMYNDAAGFFYSFCGGDLIGVWCVRRCARSVDVLTRSWWRRSLRSVYWLPCPNAISSRDCIRLCVCVSICVMCVCDVCVCGLCRLTLLPPSSRACRI